MRTHFYTQYCTVYLDRIFILSGFNSRHCHTRIIVMEESNNYDHENGNQLCLKQPSLLQFKRMQIMKNRREQCRDCVRVHFMRSWCSRTVGAWLATYHSCLVRRPGQPCLQNPSLPGQHYGQLCISWPWKCSLWPAIRGWQGVLILIVSFSSYYEACSLKVNEDAVCRICHEDMSSSKGL